jgi:hypothetical protein
VQSGGADGAAASHAAARSAESGSTCPRVRSRAP